MAANQADWCLATHQSVETYLRLTRVERDAFVELLLNTRNT